MVQLIDKDRILAEIEKRLHANGAFDEVGDEAWAEDIGMCNAYKSILSFLDALEVKEVDLEKEVDDVMRRFLGHITCREEQLKFAKHFFELGMQVSNKAQKGEEV